MKRLPLAALLLVGCVRSAPPLAGTLSPDRSLPAIALRSGHHNVVFRWDYQEGEIAARGDGSVRIAAPDSARLDFFLGGGLGAGAAILIGDSLRTPRADLARRYIPPPPMMWAALYQQRPAPEDGDYFKADWLRPIDIMPARETMYVYGASERPCPSRSAILRPLLPGACGKHPRRPVRPLRQWRSRAGRRSRKSARRSRPGWLRGAFGSPCWRALLEEGA